jgi:hypothetical protein
MYCTVRCDAMRPDKQKCLLIKILYSAHTSNTLCTYDQAGWKGRASRIKIQTLTSKNEKTASGLYLTCSRGAGAVKVLISE